MKSRYPLLPEYAGIRDNSSKGASRPAAVLANAITRARTRRVKIPGDMDAAVYQIEGFRGGKIPVHLYAPKGLGAGAPCILNFHGGAFVGAEMPHQLEYSFVYAREAGCRVAFPSYRLALNHPFPTPAEDCYAALCWVWDNAEALGIDPGRIAVLGDSAGGALAAAVTQMARDRTGPNICYQMLIYPVTDSSQTTPSVAEFQIAPVFNALCNRRMWEYYLKDGDFGMPQYAAPLLAGDLSGLPPAYIETAQFDCLRDEARLYAQKLTAAGVPAELVETKGTFHGYDMDGSLPFAKKMLDARARLLKRVLHA